MKRPAEQQKTGISGEISTCELSRKDLSLTSYR